MIQSKNTGRDHFSIEKAISQHVRAVISFGALKLYVVNVIFYFMYPNRRSGSLHSTTWKGQVDNDLVAVDARGHLYYPLNPL